MEKYIITEKQAIYIALGYYLGAYGWGGAESWGVKDLAQSGAFLLIGVFLANLLVIIYFTAKNILENAKNQ